MDKEIRNPMIYNQREYWRSELGIKVGMSKSEAFEKFREWQMKKKTCQRCEGEKLVQFCPIHSICMEAQNERDAEGDDNGSGINQINGLKTLRIEVSEARKRTAIR
jgi:hypothetical protein